MGNLDFMADELDRLRTEGLYNTIRTLESAQGAWIKVEGKRVLNLCSNNYLGFGNDPRLVERARQALESHGIGPGAVRSIAGTMDLHLELEDKLARFKGAEAALSVQSGLIANVATVPAILESAEDAVFTDALNHASIIDAVRLTKAKRFIYRHSDVDDLRKKLIATCGDNVVVRRFARFELGEGIEKKKEDLAAEVAAQIAASQKLS